MALLRSAETAGDLQEALPHIRRIHADREKHHADSRGSWSGPRLPLLSLLLQLQDLINAAGTRDASTRLDSAAYPVDWQINVGAPYMDPPAGSTLKEMLETLLDRMEAIP
jgi:hypothetical protein